MKFNPDLVKTVIKELEEVPNIRHVFKKLGIHRSTYYKWIVAHQDFREQVMFSLHKGRENISDLAEGNIIRGVKEGKLAESRFYLTHNEPRYMSSDKHKHYWDLIRHQVNMNNDEDGELRNAEYFESYFMSYAIFQSVMDPKKAKEQMDTILMVTMNGDTDFMEVFYSCHEEWKTNYEKKEGHLEALRQGAERLGIDPEKITDTQDSLFEKDIGQVIQKAMKKTSNT